jgi:hypothetical protein
MNNKRYVLVKTKAPETAELWELETGRCLQKFSEPFADVKERLAKYDQHGTKDAPQPASWCTVDLRLGVSFTQLTLISASL